MPFEYTAGQQHRPFTIIVHYRRYHMQFKPLVGGLAVATALTLALAPLQAQAVNLDFNMDGVHPAGASISYAGGAAPV
jgi:hypothetical protein